ncbi:MAG: aldehyde dehydrogenase family protein, partial [Deltaproteobacteria bacterium]|nr:aldehyde dehydrogenase family protein [Deltaproteobacteria bacterium]
PVEEVAVFEGGPEVSEALLEKRFDHVFFTGSTRVGRSVAAAAARHLSTTTLELGGKSPAIVDASACLEKAAERILWGKFINAGQTCVAPDHVLIHEDALSGFLEHARRILSTRYGATPEARRECPSFCRLVSGGHLRGLAALLDAAKAEGAKVAFGGGMDPAQRYMEPTLVTGVLPGSPLMREELFGPVLPILTFRDLDEAIRLVREGEKPLALYVFAESRDAVERVLRGTTAGGTSVNTVMVHLANPELPFGGVGESGMGSYHGRHGFRTFSHERAVLRQGPLDTLRMFYPPYTEAVQGLLRKAMRFLA